MTQEICPSSTIKRIFAANKEAEFHERQERYHRQAADEHYKRKSLHLENVRLLMEELELDTSAKPRTAPLRQYQQDLFTEKKKAILASVKAHGGEDVPAKQISKDIGISEGAILSWMRRNVERDDSLAFGKSRSCLSLR